MKSYDEITKNLLERRERYFADKKKRIKKTLGIILPVCSITVISLLVLGVFKADNVKDALKLSADVQQTQNDLSAITNQDNVNITDKETKETTKANKINKGDKVSNKYTDKPTGELIVSDEQSESMSDYNSDLSSGRLPNKEHSNNKDHNQELWGNTTTTDVEKCVVRIEVTQMPVKTVYYVGDKFDLRGLEVIGYFSNGDVEDITPYIQVHYDVATTPNKNYRVEIEYTDNSEYINVVSTSIYVTVLEPGITISDNSLKLGLGESHKLDAFTEATGCKLTWHTTDPNVVTVDNDGNAVAVGEGKASIYAQLVYDCPGKPFVKTSDYCTITVS